ncbi:MAG: hypothetical protein CUN56_04765 [Phototrophicales bacterium]|nr:MAG: hypothetical protein CUN56_04765 [Phototrophicales bacterium]RMG72272.1 MAG: hypothetical protein D6711_13290 [Chloroflexota bacterium]
MTKYVFLLLATLLTASALVTAQSISEDDAEALVELVLDRITATEDSLVNVDVYAQGAHVAGADVALEVDTACLRIERLLPGEYLPTTVEQGGYSPYEEQTEYTARLAANVTDTSKITSSRGRFFRVQIRVICEASAQANITITRAELVNDQLQLLTPTVRNAALTVVPRDSQTVTSNDTNLLWLVAFVLMGSSAFGGLFLFLFWRRKQKREK